MISSCVQNEVMKPRINYTVHTDVSPVWALSHSQALPFSGPQNRKPLKLAKKVMELPVETYCGGQAQGRFVERPESEPSHPQAAFVFLTLFSLPGYVAAEANVYKFLTLRCPLPRFRVFDIDSLPAGILFSGISVLTASVVYFSQFRSPSKRPSLIPSLESPISGSRSSGLEVGPQSLPMSRSTP